MENKRKFNIVLDIFMEKKVTKMMSIKPFKRELYYNDKDKHWILYELDPADAERIWNDLKHYVLTKNIKGLHEHGCPFCLYQNIKYNTFTCDYCVYKYNHRNYMCSNTKSDFSKIVFEYKDYFTYDVYKQFIDEINETFFQIQNTNNKSESLEDTRLIKIDINQVPPPPKVRFGDVVCWTESTTNKEFSNRPCLVTYSNIVLLENPRQTWSFGHMDIGLLKDIEEMIIDGQLMLMDDVKSLTLTPPKKPKDLKHHVTYGDIICWTKSDSRISLIGKPCLVTYSNIVLLENPKHTWSLGLGTKLLKEVEEMIAEDKMRLMDEINTITLNF